MAQADTARGDPTRELYDSLRDAAAFYNEVLFGDRLRRVLFTVQRKKNMVGYFWANRWINRDGEVVHEIALNPHYLASNSLLGTLSTIVHEQCHQAQHERGDKVRRYHDRRFAALMEEVGLITSATGLPGGKRTGHRMTHYVRHGGPFHRATIDLLRQGMVVRWVDRDAAPILKDRVYRDNGEVVPAAELAREIARDQARTGGEESSSADDADDGAGGVVDSEASDLVTLLNAPFLTLPGFPGGDPANGGGSFGEPKRRNKTCYACGSCGVKVWGRPALKLMCVPCGAELRAAEAPE